MHLISVYLTITLLRYFILFQRWARAYRDREYHAAVHTNNDVEAPNKLLKYTCLPRRKNITLSEVLMIIINVYLPDSYQKYLMKNYQMSETYRTYKDFVPDYLRGRSRGVIIHCLQRIEKGKNSTNQTLQRMLVK